MLIKDLIVEVEKIAPAKLAQQWDNVGFLIGNKNNNTENALLTIDITNAVLQEAIDKKCNLIISYHPIIWDGLKKITENGQGHIVQKIIQAGISVYSIHTSLDVVKGGINDCLADIIGIENAKPIGDFVSTTEDKYKLIVFVPAEHINNFSKALFEAGAGTIGNYSNCSFQSAGQGSFMPLEQANPFIGKKNKVETVEEIKFETIVSAQNIGSVIRALRAAHPYEEPAFDVIELSDIEKIYGLGRIGSLKKASSLEAILANIKKSTGCDMAGIIGRKNKKIKKAAVCAGSCGKILNQIIASGCDLYLTGELKHHEALAAQEADLTVICLSHSNSERFILKKIAAKLERNIKNVKIKVSSKDKDPFSWTKI